MLNIIIFRKSRSIRGNELKNCRAGHATNDRKVHVHCMLDNYGYRHTHKTLIPIAFP